MKLKVVLAAIVIIVLIFFIANYPFDSKKESGKIVPIIKKYVNTDEFGFYESIGTLEPEKAAALKKELEAFKYYYFVPKPAQVVNMADFFQKYLDFSIAFQKYKSEKYEFDLAADPCQILGKINEEQEKEKTIIGYMDSTISSAEKFAGDTALEFDFNMDALADAKSDFESRVSAFEKLKSICGGA